jgi:hypothetical protein
MPICGCAVEREGESEKVEGERDGRVEKGRGRETRRESL